MTFPRPEPKNPAATATDDVRIYDGPAGVQLDYQDY